MTTVSEPMTMRGDVDDFRDRYPDIYRGIPADVYHALDACSASRLDHMDRSALHCRYAIDHPDDQETEAKTLGTAAHACLLEPAEFAKAYAIGPDVDLRTKDGKEIWKAFTDANAGKCLVRGADGQRLRGMHAAVWSHPKARALLSSPGPCELSIVWDDAGTDLTCKLRDDHVCELAKRPIIVDLKAVRDASPHGFARACAEYGFHRRAAFYLQGHAAVKDPRDAYLFIAVEKEPPHAVGVYAIEDDDVQRGADELVSLMDQYATCERTGVWRGYSEQIEYVKLPW